MPDINQNPSIDNSMELSEIKYQDIIDSILDNIVEVDMKGNFTYVSPQSYDLFGFRPEEVIGTNGFEVVHPDDLPKLTLAMKNAIPTGETITAEYRALHKDGHYVHVSAKGRYLKEKNKIISVLRDVSKQKEAERRLQESEQKYREIIENIQNGYFEVDLKGIFTFVNDYLCKFIGYSKDEIIGNCKRLFM
jgi:PAS domain S-box-containing protein